MTIVRYRAHMICLKRKTLENQMTPRPPQHQRLFALLFAYGPMSIERSMSPVTIHLSESEKHSFLVHVLINCYDMCAHKI